MTLKTPGSVVGDVGGGVACRLEVDLDRSRVIEEPNDVDVVRRGVRDGAVSDFAEPPQAVASLVPKMCPGEKYGEAEGAEPEAAGDERVAVGEEDLTFRSR